jgi:hypothetical protein
MIGKWARNVPPGAETSRQLQKFTRGMGSYSREEILSMFSISSLQFLCTDEPTTFGWL